MRKQILSITAIAVAVALQSCGGEKAAETTEEPVEEVAEATPENWMVDSESSNVFWHGHTAGAQVYGHKGTISILEGRFTTKGQKLLSGNVVIDMTKISVDDKAREIRSVDIVQVGGRLEDGTDEWDIIPVTYEASSFSDEHPASDLVAHLSSDDFFNVDPYPTATFVVKSTEGNAVTGDLTIKGKTHEETINVESMNISEDGMTAAGTLVFDRQKYDVAWEHYLQDVILSDDIKLDFNITAKKA